MQKVVKSILWISETTDIGSTEKVLNVYMCVRCMCIAMHVCMCACMC